MTHDEIVRNYREAKDRVRELEDRLADASGALESTERERDITR